MKNDLAKLQDEFYNKFVYSGGYTRSDKFNAEPYDIWEWIVAKITIEAKNDDLLNVAGVSVPLLEQVKVKFSQITDDERMEVMSDYCDHCGCSEKNSKCYCAPRYDI